MQAMGFTKAANASETTAGWIGFGTDLTGSLASGAIAYKISAAGVLTRAPRGTFDLSQSVGAARVSSWGSRLEGTRLKQVGNYWIKEVDPNASAFRQWWGRGSLNAQARALDRLGDLAPSHLFSNGKLIIRDVGEFAGTRGDFWRTWLQGSIRLRTPFNDIRVRNIGANGQIFDPALHPIQQAIYWGGSGLIIYKGGELIYVLVGGEE